MSKCIVRHRKTNQGIENRAVHSGPLSAVMIKSALKSIFSSLLFVYFTLFLFSFKWGHSKTWVASYPLELFFQAYYLNHWRYVGKTGHPIKSWKRPPVLTYSGGTESDSLWKEHLCRIERQWNGTGKVQEYFIVLFCLFSTDSDHLVSWGRYTGNCVLRQNTSKP